MKLIAGLGDIAHLFRPGVAVVMHSACAAPPLLSRQLAELSVTAGPFDLFDMTPMGGPAYLDGVRAGTLRLTTYVPGRDVRGLPQVTVIRAPLSSIPVRFGNGQLPAEILLLHLAPPDESGRLSLGLSCDAMPAVLRRNPIVIAEINPSMPRTLGGTLIDPGLIDYCIEAAEAPLTVPPVGGDRTDVAIAENVASLLRDGDVLQIGIGSIPELMLGRLGHLRNLGIHTGIISDSLRPLIESGVVTNGGKSCHAGVTVTTMAAGTESFYRFLHGNRLISVLPCSITHDITTLAGLGNFCAVNSALEVDLMGNVNAERLDGRLISAPGGMPDFAAGATASPGGRSIISLRAASREGSISRIRLDLAGGGPVSLVQDAVDFVVTEHGVARVRGLSPGDRARAVIAIAAPQFRAGLRRAL